MDYGLENYDILAFAGTWGPVLTNAERKAIEDYVNSGGHIFCTKFCLAIGDGWDFWWDTVMGGKIRDAKRVKNGGIPKIDKAKPEHPAAKCMTNDNQYDGGLWYNFNQDLPNGAEAVFTVQNRQFAWHNEVASGARIFYTATGEKEGTFTKNKWLSGHFYGAMRWLVGLEDNDFDCKPLDHQGLIANSQCTTINNGQANYGKCSSNKPAGQSY